MSWCRFPGGETPGEDMFSVQVSWEGQFAEPLPILVITLSKTLLIVLVTCYFFLTFYFILEYSWLTI